MQGMEFGMDDLEDILGPWKHLIPLDSTILMKIGTLVGGFIALGGEFFWSILGQP